jgi:hypothetical protein
MALEKNKVATKKVIAKKNTAIKNVKKENVKKKLKLTPEDYKRKFHSLDWLVLDISMI